MITIVPNARPFVSNELEALWNENFPNTMVSYGLHDFTIYFISNFKNEMLGTPGYNLPEKKDLLCVISLKQKKASYYLNEKLFDDEKDYIVALKNIAFL